jgi:hypothetical protein
MKTNIIKLVAALAWGGVAVSSATQASAIAVTSQTGNYASCSADYTATSNGNKYCSTFTTSYSQTIKMVSTSCNTGACAGSGLVFVGTVYSIGRKIATLQEMCDYGNYKAYGLGTCAC